MKKKTTLATLFLCLAATTASAQMTNQGAVMPEAPAGTGSLSAPLGDAEFVRRAIIASRFEFEEARLALGQATDPRLKDFARTMVMDHGEALKDLETAAGMAGVTLPDRKVDQTLQARLNVLSRKKGADFDQQYRADQRQAHDEAITLLVAYQQSGKSEQLRAWAIKALPMVRKHRETIGALSAP